MTHPPVSEPPAFLAASADPRSPMSAAPMELLREGSLLGGELRTVRRNAIAYAPQDAVSFDGKMGQEFSSGER